jgi:hypothetical protein
MSARDRLTNLGLLGAATLAWAVVVVLFATRSPVGNVGLQVLGASLLGIAFALTTLPLFWLVVFTRHGRIAYRGDWAKALRRGATVGLVVTVLVVLRSQGAFSWPLALFIVAMAVFVEVRLSAPR